MRDSKDLSGLVRKPREAAGQRIFRFAVAIIGASAITIGLLLFMHDLVSRFLERDPTRYFSITSFIPAPDRGRQLPNVPIAPARAPDAPEVEYEEESGIILELPEVVIESEVRVPGQVPVLEN